MTPSLIKVSFLQRCPKCGVGKLYVRGLQVVPKCAHCGLSLQNHDMADGPAFFVMFFISIIIVPFAVWLDNSYQPPLWVHLVLWIPFVMISAVGLLRICKACLLAMAYRHHLLEGPSHND